MVTEGKNSPSIIDTILITMTEITANYDETWKEVIGDYFDSFLAFFYSEIYQQIDWTKNPISLDN